MRTLTCIALVSLVIPFGALDVSAEDAEVTARDAMIERLIEALGADDFRTREEASGKLAALGEDAKPALEEAARSSKSPEVRWRVGQLLRRLRGGREQPLGGEDAAPGRDDLSEEELKDPILRIRKMIEQFKKRWGQRGDPRDAPFGGPLTARRRIEVPGLVLERISPGSMQLRVKRKNEGGAEVEDILQGTSLKDIVLRNPELANHPGMEALRRKEAENSWPGFDDFFKRHLPHARTTPGRGGTFSFSTSQGVSVTQDADGVTVKITEKDENGEPKTKEYKGESVEALKEKHPELAEKLGSFTLRLRAPHFLWPGSRSRSTPLRPLTPRSPTTPRAAPEGESPFGLVLTTPNEILAIHLGLDEGKGALVVEVRPGSQAAQLGVLPNDIIVKVGGEAVDLASAVSKLRAAGRQKAAVAVEIIRRGKTLALQR